MFGHGLTQLAPKFEGVLSAFVLEQLCIDLGLARQLGGVTAISVWAFQAMRVFKGVGTGAESSKNATDQ
jgi:hypothetical protein